MADMPHSAKNRKPWDRMLGEPDKVYYAFKCCLDLPYWERKVLYAYPDYVGNPEEHPASSP